MPLQYASDLQRLSNIHECHGGRKGEDQVLREVVLEMGTYREGGSR